MWTPKRVLILLGSFVFFTTLFGFYFHYLGYLDGLPELPDRFWPSGKASAGQPPTSAAHNDKIFQDAFGPECEELTRPIRLFLRSKGLAFATKKFEIAADARVKLTPFSCVVFKSNGGSYPEINTVRSESAYLTLDKPVSSLSELGTRKIIAVELVSASAIQITNNRRTEATSDDITVAIRKVTGADSVSLFFDDSRNLVWSHGKIEMLDGKTSPPTRIEAVGMEIHLTRAGQPTKAKAAAKSDAISGVELLHLTKNVVMYLFTDPNSGFLAGPTGDAPKNTPARNPSGPAAKKSQIVISTDGPFEYDLVQERAHFQCDRTSPAQRDVKVTRSFDEFGKPPSDEDEIKCDDLVLFFRQRPATPGAANHGDKGNEQGEKEIDRAIATGKQVHVSMLTEKVEAYGTEMIYRSATEVKGPQTTIKGLPMYAIKEGHKITAPELYLVGGDKNGMGQEAQAHGAGTIDMLDAAHPGKHSQHASWKDEMSFVKINKNGLLLDKMVLKGDAKFEDDQRQQTLRGQEIMVWLEPAGRGEASAGKPVAAKPLAATPAATATPAPAGQGQAQGPLGSSNTKLHRLEALRDVSYVSLDVHIELPREPVSSFPRCDFLVITTRDKEIKPGTPDTLPKQVGTPPSRPDQRHGGPDAPRTTPLDRMNGGNSDPPAPLGTEPPAIAKNRPIRLWAKTVRVSVLRIGAQNELDTLVAEEDVHVLQDGETPKDKGVDIQGAMLNLVQHEQGKILYVDGDDKAAGDRKYGRLLMNDMLMVGPKISINQKDNIAQTDGQGYLNMPSNSNLDGTKSTRSDARMTVYWNERMEFNGRTANFYGGVQAVQENSRLRCQKLQVIMDRVISFKEGQKDSQTAKIDRIVCERDCAVLERILDEKTGKLIRQQTGQFRELDVDNLDNKTRGYGPGCVTSFSMDGGDPKNPNPNPKAKTKEQMKLTRVLFRGWLWTTTHENTRKSKFYDYVEVYHLPTDNPDVNINPAAPPKDGFFLRCHLLEVYARPVNGKTAQFMEARRQVVFQTDEFFGRADIVKFDEADDIIIFEADPGNIVTITKIVNSQPGQTITGRKILYNRKTGEFKVEGGLQING